MSRRLALACCLLAAGSPTAAQSAGAAASTFTAASYVRAVLDAAPEVRQAAALFEATRAAWKSQTASAWLPTLSVAGSAYPYGHDRNEDFRFQHWNLARGDTALNESININLFNSFADYFKTRQAALARDTAEQSLGQTEQGRALAAAQSFYDLGLKQRLLEVAADNLKIQKDAYDLTLDHYQNGMKSLADLLKGETDWHSSELTLAQAEAARRQSLLQFNLLIDRPADAPAMIQAELESGATARPELESDLAAALRRRPELLSARLAVDVEDASVAQAVQAGAPQFSVNASYNHYDNGENVGNPFVNLGANPNYQLSLSLALPAGFNGASQWFNVSAARRRLAAARQTLAATTRQVRSDVHSSFIALDAALSQYRIAVLTEDVARRSFELVTEQYKQGSVDSFRLAQAQVDYETARTSRAQNLFSVLGARYQYRWAIGEPLWK